MPPGQPPKISLRDILAKVDNLPSIPEAALRLSRMMEDPNVNAEKLANVIRVDATMTSHVLRLCNSAAYGFSRRIQTVKEAVAILGMNTLRSIVYIIISKFALDRSVPGYGLSRGSLWLNAITCAVYAKHLAEQRRLIDPELAFTGALLRDIGKIILGEYVGPNYANIEALTSQKKIDFVAAEEEVLGINHVMVGMKVAEHWNLPESLVKVIRYHHSPSQLKKEAILDKKLPALVAYVHLADAFSMMVGSGVGSDGMMYSLDLEALKEIQVVPDQLYLDLTLAKLIDLQHIIDSFTESMNNIEVS